MPDDTPKKHETASGYHFSPGKPRPKAPPPEPPKGRASPRSDLESLDEVDPAALKASGPPPPAEGDGDSAPGREERVVCSFPGLMKVLVPERSFIPIPLAVRVANLSSGGALVEIHDRARVEGSLTLPDRFFELKVAHPEIPELRGSIAWTDFSHDKPMVGLSFFERNESFSSLFLVSDSHRDIAGPPPLPELSIDGFPPICHEETIVLTGAAPEALEVVVRSEDREQVAKVRDHRFEVKLELSPDRKNTFTLQARAGVRTSRQVPIQIVFERRTNTNKFTFSLSQNQERDGTHIARLQFSGNMRQAERMLYRFSQIWVSGDRMVFDATVYSAEEFERRLIDGLRSEGTVLSADTTKNEVAARLLDELLF